MPTPSEQKALTFVAMIVLLGGAVRVVRAGGTPGASRLEQQALARQATAVESAAAAAKARQAGRGTRARKASADSTRESRTSGARSPAGPKAVAQGLNGFPPPGPRIDVDYRPNRRTYRSEVSGTATPPMVVGMGSLIDLDRASEREIDALPRVGPALARRLVANRDSFGAFGSLEALGRVRGFGPATRKRLSPLVTFSGGPSSRP